MPRTIVSHIVPEEFKAVSELPFGAGQMHEDRYHATDEDADHYIQVSRAMDQMQEMQKLIARMEASRAIFDKYTHYITIETESGKVFGTGFPTLLAKHSHKRELDYGQAQDASFLLSPDGMRFVVLDWSHIPDIKKVCDDAKALEPMMDPNDRLLDPDKRAARIQVFHGQVDIDQDAAVEAELIDPMPISIEGERFRMVVHGGSGTNANERRSCWISPAEVCCAVDENFSFRQSMLSQIAGKASRSVHQGNEVTVSANQTLLAGNSFLMDLGLGSPSDRFLKGIDIQFPTDAKAVLMDFKLVRTASGVCIGSATVGFRFKPPRYGHSSQRK
jgi:hypothetical protein